MKKLIYATVVYSCEDFKIFLSDYLKSVFNQTNHNFELLILSDDVDLITIKNFVSQFKNEKKIHYEKNNKNLSPVLLRQELIDISYELGADTLIFSDFDESVAENRVEEIALNINNYDFVFNDFFIVDKNINKLYEQSFFQMRNLPDLLVNYKDIISYNYVGLGSMALNLSKYNFRKIKIPSYIKAFDWFIATKVLIDGGSGKKIKNTFANYRQHDKSFIGFGKEINAHSLNLGLKVKEGHYNFFKDYCNEYKILYKEILFLKKFIQEIGEKNYINQINSNLNLKSACWWENIKIKGEINS